MANGLRAGQCHPREPFGRPWSSQERAHSGGERARFYVAGCRKSAILSQRSRKRRRPLTFLHAFQTAHSPFQQGVGVEE